jgi:WD40 repeat protein
MHRETQKMSETFLYDLFLSHSSKDKAVVRPIAERLRADGLKVWFDEWELKPSDSIPSKIEEGLEHSRVLVLCMSANAFGSDWAQLESGTFRFRDPLNKDRRFIPLRLDDAPIKGSLAQFLYINWCPTDDEQEYAKLLEACLPLVVEEETATKQSAERFIQLNYNHIIWAYAFSPDGLRFLSAGLDHTLRLWDMETGSCLSVFEGHSGPLMNTTWSDDQSFAVSSGWWWGGHSVRLWDVETAHCLRVFECEMETVFSVALSADKKLILSGGEAKTLRLWSVDTGCCLRVFEGHTESVHTVAWSNDQLQVLSGSEDSTMRLWNVETGRCLCVFKGHTRGIHSVAWSNDQLRALSGSEDRTMRLWDLKTGHCLRVFEGHTGGIDSIAWGKDQRMALSASKDNTVWLWDVEKGCCRQVLEGHRCGVKTVAWSADGCRAFSGDKWGGIQIWDLSEFVTEVRKAKVTVSAPPEQVQYTNAKVLLVGDSGVGKTGLSNRLARDFYEETDSTDGAWATHWTLPHAKKNDGVDREIWLWDFAGQVDYRLVHQLFMDDTAAAVLVFNPQNENPYEGLGHWERDLQKAARKPFAKLLAAGRKDRGGLVVSAARMEKFMAERGFCSPLYLTSAKMDEGCEELRNAIVQAIDWQSIPETTSPALYHRLKQEILHLRDSGLVLIRQAELKQRMEMTLRGEEFKLEELATVVSLLAGPGMIQRLDFGGFILLRPEVLSRYAAAVVRMVRSHPQEMGCIREDELLNGDLDYQDFKRLSGEDEGVVLRTLLETFVSRAWCLRQPCDGTAILTFPSYFRRERKEQPSHPSVLVSYRFDGPSEEIYASLVVRLHHTVAFDSAELWKSAADFRTQSGAKLGFAITREAEGTSRLEVYFEPDVDENSRVLFLRYVHDHLMQHAQNVVRLRHYACGDTQCAEPFTDQVKIDKALAPGGKGKVFCPACGTSIILLDLIEEKFDSPAVKEEVRRMEYESALVIDNESRELMAVHHTGFIVAEAGQIYRGYTNSDHGIDGEIEFKDDQGRASGKRLYMQLKSGDSYLKKRQRDDVEVFQIKNPRWSEYWQQQAYTVMLVIRTSDGEIRWMDVSAYLKRESVGGKIVTQIIFEGERFDVMSVRRWRDKSLSDSLS